MPSDREDAASAGRKDDPIAEAMLERAIRDYPEVTALDDLLAEAGVEGPAHERMAAAAVSYAALIGNREAGEAASR